MDMWTDKVVSLVVIFIFTFGIGLIPKLVISRANDEKKRNKVDTVFSYLNSFSGGIFFATCLVHLLTEAREEMETFFMEIYEKNVEFPVTEVLAGAGFFLVLFIEVFASKCHRRHSSTIDPTSGDQNHEAKILSVENRSSEINVISEDKENCAIKSCQDKQNGVLESESCHDNRAYTPDDSCVFPSQSDKQSHPHKALDREIETEEDPDVVVHTPVLRAIVLIIVLSLHTIFDGLAIGLQDEESQVWVLFGVLLVHKCLIAFSLGLRLVKAFTSLKKVVLSLVVFACMSPLGVAIGIWITESNSPEAVRHGFSGILQSLATGTFLYVTFFEIMQHELAHSKKISKIILCVIGFGIVAALRVLDAE